MEAQYNTKQLGGVKRKCGNLFEEPVKRYK